MFQYEKDEFGGKERFKIFDPEKGNSMTVIPEHGGHLQEVLLGGVSVVDGFQTVEEMEKNFKSKSNLLFPFPNRLKNGTYQHEGETYHLPINNQSTGNAIHGIGRKVDMHVHSIELGDEEADIHLRYEYTGDQPGYPFSFAFTVSYYFRANGSFDVSVGLHNFSNTNIPVGLGWHPYFQLEKNIAAVQLQLPKVNKIAIDEFMIPTGEKIPFDQFQTLQPIADTVFDNGFEIVEQGGRAEVLLQKGKNKLRYWQETGEGKFNFIQVYIPPARNSIALEPMTCNIDAFNNKDGLTILKPGQGIMGRCGFFMD